MRRLILSTGMLIGSVLVGALVHFSGGDSAASVDPENIKVCAAGQSPSTGCLPPEYANIQQQQQQTQDLANQLNSDG